MARKKSSKDAAAPIEETSAFKKVGRLASLGLTEPWQVALLMPAGYDDFRQPAPAAAALQARGVLWLQPEGPVRTSFSSGVPRTTVSMRDGSGALVWATIFGDTKQWAPRLQEGNPGWFVCEPDVYRDELRLKIVEEVPEDWIGRMRPRYAGKPQYLAADKVRDVVHKWLDRALPLAASWLQERLEPLVGPDHLAAAAGTPGWTLIQVLEEAHLPSSPTMAETARQALRRVAAFSALAKVHAHILNRPPARAMDLRTCGQRSKAFGFELTSDQDRAIRTLTEELRRPVAMRALLVGDVGSGKTCVFASIAAGVADAGGRTAILLPNLPLAEQVHREIAQAWPDLSPVLVTGGQEAGDLRRAKILIGTTALLHRTVGTLDLVVVDEEQKFSVEQREQLAGAAGHLLTSSATCIPRSQALARYGALTICELRQGHAKKDIQTRLWTASRKAALFAEIRAHLASGEQLLVIYPMKERGEQPIDPRHTVEQGRHGWEQLCSGRVRALTGDDDDATKTEVMAAMRDGTAQVLLATTVVEVGITLPGLRRMMIVAPDRYGLTQLHQLRGRLARHGGHGWCDLYAPEALGQKAAARLDAFMRCRDGFEVAQMDLELRGFGDLAQGASRQSGADRDILFGDAPGPEDVAAMENLWARVARSGSNA